MNIALDFDGVVVDKYDSSFLYINVWNNISENNIVDIVTARSKISFHFIERILQENNILVNEIICCEDERKKIDYLNNSFKYDIVIDNSLKILNNIDVLIVKIAFGQIENFSLSNDNILIINSITDLDLLLNKRKTFSPGFVPFYSYNFNLDYHHRSEDFQFLITKINNYFSSVFNYKNIIVQGSASLAVECIANSLLRQRKIIILENGVFSQRAAEVISQYTSFITYCSDIESLENHLSEESFDFFYAVQFETSESLYNDLSGALRICKEKKIMSIIDIVSSFPYYDFLNSDILILSSSKLLRALPVLGIILFSDSIEEKFQDIGDNLNLSKYIKYKEKNQTPHTSLLPQIYSLCQQLLNLDIGYMRMTINNNCSFLCRELDNLIYNNSSCPVISLKIKHCLDLEEYTKKYKCFYYFNDFYMNDRIQISLFSYLNPVVYKYLNIIFLNYTKIYGGF